MLLDSWKKSILIGATKKYSTKLDYSVRYLKLDILKIIQIFKNKSLATGSSRSNPDFGLKFRDRDINEFRAVRINPGFAKPRFCCFNFHDKKSRDLNRGKKTLIKRQLLISNDKKFS